MSDLTRPARPVHRNIHVLQLLGYRLPLSGIISILHRVSGALMFLLLPFILFMLDRSLTSELSFRDFKSVASFWLVKLVILALVWAYLHHFCAGIRHLAMDLHIGVDKDSGRQTAAVAMSISLFITLVIALKLFGAF